MAEHSLNILIVEDEPVVLQTLQLILQQKGYSVRGASNGEDAERLWAQFPADVLLCDINLPRANGIQVAVRFREATPNARVILFSGDAQSGELLEEAKKQGHSFEVLAKPTDPRRLLNILAGGKGSLGGDPHKIHRVK
jgi:CheY-like chemotaxis protein